MHALTRLESLKVHHHLMLLLLLLHKMQLTLHVVMWLMLLLKGNGSCGGPRHLLLLRGMDRSKRLRDQAWVQCDLTRSTGREEESEWVRDTPTVRFLTILLLNCSSSRASCSLQG